MIFRSSIYITIADADIGSLKSRHTLFDTYLDHMLVKFEPNRMVRTIQIFVLFDKKLVNHFWQSIDTILEDVILWLKPLFDAKLLI